MNNVSGATEVPLGVFGGNNLDMQPTDLPAGLSPDNSDCAFLPGSVFTRPSLKRLRSLLPVVSQVIYSTTFLKPDGSVSQLDFLANGQMYADGVQFGQTAAGNRFFTCNAFGKMYIAISDGLHGADVPLQYTPEGFLDRVSQDGPGAPPTITNYSLPPVALVAGAAGPSIAITQIVPIDPEQVQTGNGQQQDGFNPPQYETYFTALLVQTATPHGLTAGTAIAISGNSLYSFGTVYISFVDSTTSFEVSNFTQDSSLGIGGTVATSAPLLVRNNNQVTATTATPHNLRVGYKVNITGVPDASQSITSIVVDNETLNGVATVTTPVDHGLVPGDEVSIVNVQPVTVGGTITAWTRTDGVILVTTASNHGLQPGESILVQLETDGFGPVIVASVPSLNTFSYSGAGGNGTGTAGLVQLPWPLASGTVFTISQVPSATTFQIPFSFGDGTWTTGAITFAWNGVFYVTSLLSDVSFTYSQTGPNALIQSGSGTVIPTGQIEPGTRSVVEIFLTRTGYLTIPSPPVQITASGGQYLFASNNPIGPSNVVARWLAFTGANGGKYFILPIPPRDPAGQFQIGTSTVIPDNTTTSAIFDFSDEALFNGIAIDIPGNNLFRQQVLGPCLGFFSYGSRLLPWGERNKIQQFLNMGFEGGVYASAPNAPLGWTIAGGDGTLTPGDYGLAWTATTATISQSAFRDQFGAAIIQPNTKYIFRAWVNGNTTATLSSASTGFSTSANIAGNGIFSQVVFDQATPINIPSDLRITLTPNGITSIDEIEIIYAEDPYILTAKASYVNNPEAFDGVTGILGPVGDPHPVNGMEERKDVLCLLTSGPEGSLYETEQTASGEPATWDIRHIASKCGLISVWGATKFEDWFCWTSDTGLRIFDGANVEKMSQEIQPWWNTINPRHKQLTVLANDPYTRRVYISAVTGSASVNNSMYVLDYRDLNTAGLLANAGTLKVGYSGKVVTTDLTRKWSPWSMTVNYCGLTTQPDGSALMVFCGGDGVSLSNQLNSAVYSLAEGTITGIDDDYGPFWQNSSYPTYFFIGDDEKQQYKVGSHRLQHNYLTMNCTGVGTVFVVPALDRLDNFSKASRALAVNENLARDLEIPLNLKAERISYRVKCQPANFGGIGPLGPAGFRLSSMVVAMITDPYSPIRGRNG